MEPPPLKACMVAVEEVKLKRVEAAAKMDKDEERRQALMLLTQERDRLRKEEAESRTNPL